MVVGLDPKTGSKYQPAYLLVHLEKIGVASHANVLRALQSFLERLREG